MLGKKNLFRTQAVILVMVLVMSALLNLSGCGNKAQEADADLAETAITPADETTDAENEMSETGETTDETETEEIEGATEAETEEGAGKEPEGTMAEETSESETEEAEAATEAESATTNAESGAATTQKSTEIETTQKSAEAATTKSGTETTSEEPTAAATSGYTYTSMSKTMYVKQQVNVRSIPSKDGSKLGALSAGSAVTVTGQCNETSWYRISYNGGTGYVSNNYLTTTKPSTTTTTKKNESTTTTKKNTETTTTKAAETTTTAATTTRTYATEAEKLAVIRGINDHRAEKGYTEMPVVLNTKLTEQAQAWADYLAENDLFEHSDDWNRVGDYYWEKESIHLGSLDGIPNILGYEEAVWEGIGAVACVHAAVYLCPFIGVGVAVNSEGYSIVVIQGWSQIALYDENGIFATDKQFDAEVNYEFVADLAWKIYDLGHFADFKHWCCYYNVYGDDDYLHIPSWLKGSTSWTTATSYDYYK